ncbi:transporter, hydrophobe/amphiphile efflux-1 (HAE1) family [Methylocella silvestris BL2]|uniref:Efflux pump membrane transporter n=1 Tax=Methylocella silvestris (strain DSM 15510 / CIP 108128 / LMG 27833 / NCIMB 13906 / BL2) TaxID=395965 RepID=B8EST2_METSB|nr:efflux RND transporter permease subunit [Methylocella silvestris]ACK50417.1 transporter, hydrophobe/amphiphile efflux-1 (HAE1) family [Methylocella silvestris BL2]
MSRFFIDHPVFAWVLAIIVMLAGAVAVLTLPIAQYPSIAPPAVSISVTYPGASAETVQSTVVQVIEQQLSGLDHLLYFSSESDKDGSITITLSFDQGTNPDIAQVQVQNKLQLAQPRLPQAVQQQGIQVAKATKNFLVVVGFVSTDGAMTSADLGDFIASSIQDPISRTPGVGDYQLFGSQYAMRIWLDPAKLNNYALTPGDVSAAIQAQNVQVAAGELGGLPAVKNQQLNATIIGPSYLQTPQQFGEILLRVEPTGAKVLLRDVARIELAGESYSVDTKYNGRPASALAVKLASGANALDTVKAVRATIEQLRPNFPSGVEAIYPYDTTPFVELSIHGVVETLIVAVVLVFLIMYLFLQNLRATLIPTIAVPVVLLGTCAILSLAGFSINSLTMFGMVLAIGLLVDDAIVVVENVERVMEEDHLSPKEATRKSMDEISGALVGIALVLTAVFLPMSFFGGSTGVIYRQFSITIVSSMILSVLVALVFTPALCATILKRPKEGGKRGFFGWFNRNFDRGNRRYVGVVKLAIAHPILSMLAFVGVTTVLVLVFVRIPSGFLPDEDQGVMFAQVVAPPGATSIRTQQVLDEVSDYLRTDESHNVEGVFEVNGFSFGGRGQNAGLIFVKLKDWSERPGEQNKVQAIAGRAMARFGEIKDARVFAFAPPAVLELGNATGFDFQILDRANLGHDKLMQARNQLLAEAAKDQRLVAVRPNGIDDEPQYTIVIDREKANALSLSIADINTTLSAAWGSAYVNDFIDRGRVKRVYMQGDSHSRMLPDQLDSWYVRNKLGQMVKFSSFAAGRWTYGSPKLERYGGVPSIEIMGSPAPGQSTGAAMEAMKEIASKLPPGFGYDWTGLSYEEVKSGSQTGLLYAGSLIVVFLCLAALYESWSIPVAVLLVVPLGVVGAVLATFFRGLNNDVYFQVGLLTTIGLASKNAILIVEFAKANFEAGEDLAEAAAIAARERLRPILMTSLAFILGVAPLAISTGAGSGGQNAIGTGVVGGMISATVLAIVLVPVFFVVVLRLFKVKRLNHEEHATARDLQPATEP